jgi:hypothetical protein
MDWLDIFWFILISFAFVAYLMVMFAIIGDLFRDDSTSGWLKAVWIILLIFFPFLTALVYLIAKGDGMATRKRAEYDEMRAAQDAYIKQVAGEGGGGSSAAEQISKAHDLLASGAITQDEFDRLKARALG